MKKKQHSKILMDEHMLFSLKRALFLFDGATSRHSISHGAVCFFEPKMPSSFGWNKKFDIWNMCICWLKEEPYLWVVKAIPRSLDNYLKYQYRNMSYSVKKYKYRCVYMIHYVFNIWKKHYIMMVGHLFSFAPSEIESQLVMVSRKFLSAQHG